MDLPKVTILRVIRPLDCIPEIVLQWYRSYLEQHKETLGMKNLTTYPCVLVKHKDEKLEGMLILQVDDSLILGTKVFLEDEERESRKFKKKPIIELTNTPMHFNGDQISGEGYSIKIHQAEKIAKLKPPINRNDFTTTTAMDQYIGVNNRPCEYGSATNRARRGSDNRKWIQTTKKDDKALESWCEVRPHVCTNPIKQDKSDIIQWWFIR